MEAGLERLLADPPVTWQEHWFGHRQLLGLCHSDERCAICADPGVRQAEIRWLPRFVNLTWQYSKATYGGAFGSDRRIYFIHHAGRHGGGHAGCCVSPVHDYHNVSDCGLGTWREGSALARELPAHEIGHCVESANNGVHGSPAYEVWGDSEWAEFYIDDLCTALGMDREAKGVCRRFTGGTGDFPRRGTCWFRDWFYPLWRDCGQAEVMNRFFGDLARHFPRGSGGTCTRGMNWGGYVHFTSGAAAAGLSGQAGRAFGTAEAPITAWTWKLVRQPASGPLTPRGRAWEMTRYRAYLARLAGRAIAETFGCTAAFLAMAAAQTPTPQMTLRVPLS